MNSEPPQLKDGSDWADHEDCIVGDEAGLISLIKACEIALEKNEYYGSDLGDYAGVKKLESSWFNGPVDSPQTHQTKMGFTLLIATIGALIVVGLVSLIQWLF